MADLAYLPRINAKVARLIGGRPVGFNRLDLLSLDYTVTSRSSGLLFRQPLLQCKLRRLRLVYFESFTSLLA